MEWRRERREGSGEGGRGTAQVVDKMTDPKMPRLPDTVWLRIFDFLVGSSALDGRIRQISRYHRDLYVGHQVNPKIHHSNSNPLLALGISAGFLGKTKGA